MLRFGVCPRYVVNVVCCRSRNLPISLYRLDFVDLPFGFADALALTSGIPASCHTIRASGRELVEQRIEFAGGKSIYMWMIMNPICLFLEALTKQDGVNSPH